MTTETATVPKVYAAIGAVQKQLSIEGIGKDRRNQQQNYQFRGIDDVYNSLAGLLAHHGLCILPRVLTRSVTERETQKGGVLFYVVCEVEFDFVCAEDGSKHVVRTIGEAMDSADKATNKAMSAAYKYACLQAFCIPTEGDNDADATTHEVAPRSQQTHRPSDDRPPSNAEMNRIMEEKRQKSTQLMTAELDKIRDATEFGALADLEDAIDALFDGGDLHQHDLRRLQVALLKRRVGLCETREEISLAESQAVEYQRRKMLPEPLAADIASRLEEKRAVAQQ